MRQLKITCDRCGKEITGKPWKVFIEQVGRETGECAFFDDMVEVKADFCDECAREMGDEMAESRNLLSKVEPDSDTDTDPESDGMTMEHPECCIGYRPTTETAQDAPEAPQEPSEDETGINDHEDTEEPETSPVVHDKLGRVHKGGMAKGTVMFTIPRKQKARQMYLAGKTVEEIHEEIGIPIKKLERFVMDNYLDSVRDAQNKPVKRENVVTSSGVTYWGES